MLIGEDSARIDHVWQMMLRGSFYPAGREKLDALGAQITTRAVVPQFEICGWLDGVPIL